MKSPPVNKERIFWGGLFLVLALAGLMYQYLTHKRLEQSAALFIGISAVLALGLSLLPVAKNATGNIVLGTTIALVLSMVIFREGAVCILMSIPLFLTVAAMVGQGVDAIRDSKNKNRMRVVLALLFLPLSLEGVTEDLSFNRDETVVVEQVVGMTPQMIESKMSGVPDLSTTLPLFLQLGFPVAQSYSSEDLKVGSERCFHVPARKGLSGDVCWVIEQQSSNHVLFKLVKDESKIAHWMTWRTVKVQWFAESDNQLRSSPEGSQSDAGPGFSFALNDHRQPLTDSQLLPLQRGGQTRVVVTLKFWRELDPAWYFSPLERYAVGLTGEYLIDAYLGQS